MGSEKTRCSSREFPVLLAIGSFLLFFHAMFPAGAYARTGSDQFQAEFSGVVLVLNNGDRVPLRDQELKVSQLMGGSVVGIEGKIRVIRGELLWLELKTDNSSVPLLQRAVQGSMGPGVYSFGGSISLARGQTRQVSLIATAVDPQRQGSGPSIQYPSSPITVSCETGRPEDFQAAVEEILIQLPNGKTVPLADRALQPSDLYQGNTVVLRGKVTVKKGTLSVFWLRLDNQGTPLLQSPGRPEPVGPGTYDWTYNFPIKEGETRQVSFTAEGPFGSRLPTVLNLSTKPYTLTFPKQGPVMPFTASFKSRRFITLDGKSYEFSSLPAGGLIIPSDVPVKVKLKVEWAVQAGEATGVFYSVNGNPGNPLNSLGEGAVAVEPGKATDIVFRLEGKGRDASGRIVGPVTSVLDAQHGLVTVEKPKINSFDAGFFGEAFYLGPNQSEVKKFTDLPASGFEYNISRVPASIHVGASWDIRGGHFRSVSISTNGNKNWGNSYVPPQNTILENIFIAPGDALDIVFRVEGFDTDSKGNSVGEIRTIEGKLHGRIRGKELLTPLDVTLSDPSLYVGPGHDQQKKFKDLPPGGFEYLIDKDNTFLGVGISWQTKGGQLKTVQISKDGGASHWISSSVSAEQRQQWIRLDVTPGEVLNLVFKVEGQDTDSKRNPVGPLKSFDDTVHGKVLVKERAPEKPPQAVPFNASFKESTIRIQGKDYNFSSIPSGGLRIPSSGPGVFGISASWEVRGGQVRAAYFSLNGGNSWTRFDPFGVQGASQSARSQPGDNFRIKFKLEGVAGDGSGAPRTISSSQAQVQFFRLSTFEASFRELRLKVRDRTYKFEEIPTEGLKLMSRQPVPLQVSADWEVKSGKLREAMISRNNGINSVPMKSWSPTGGSEELFANVGADLTIKLTLTGMTTDDKGNPTGDPPKRIDGPRTAHITVQYLPKPVKQLKIRFTQQKVKVGDQTKSFSQIPASGWEVTPSSGSTVQTVGVDVSCNVSVEWGRVEGAEISKDGGTSWVPAPVLDVGSSRERIFKGHFDAQPGDTLNLAFQIKGRDVYEEDRQPVGDVKSQRDSARARVVLRKASIVAPPPQVADVIGMTEPVARKALESVGYKVSWNETSTTNQKDDDRVVSVTPRAGSGLKKGETVTITLARYLPTVPSVIGLSEDDAIEQLRKDSFKARVTTANTENLREEGKVIKTLPFGGVTLSKNATVELIVGRRVFAGNPPWAVTEDAGKVLLEMGRQYAAEDFSGLMVRVSDDFPNRGELEEWLRRDFRDFDGITLNLFMKRTTDLPDGADVEADWQMRCTLTDGGRQEEVRGEGLHFIFTNREGAWKLKQMRGPNPLFGGRSPDIAVASGAPAAVSQVLQKIEDQGSRAAKQGALGIVADQVVTGTENIPVTFELVSESANYANGAQEEVDFNAIQPFRPIYGKATIRIVDNPKKIDFTGIKLQITDTADGGSVSVTGDVAADQTVIFRLTETLGFNSRDSGTLIFTLDPDNKFITIDQDKKIKRVPYQAL